MVMHIFIDFDLWCISLSYLPPDYNSLSSLCSRQQELSEVMKEVGVWWGGCDQTSTWLADTEGNLIVHKPLASSLDIIEQQKTSVQVCLSVYMSVCLFVRRGFIA